MKVPKKGHLTECDNYHGISLLSVPSKILCRVLIDRVKSGVDEMIRSRQGFDLEGELLSKSLLYGASWGSARNGKHQCTLTSLIQRHLTASSESDLGTLWGSMASLTSLSGLSRHYTIRAQAVLQKAEGILVGLK